MSKQVDSSEHPGPSSSNADQDIEAVIDRDAEQKRRASRTRKISRRMSTKSGGSDITYTEIGEFERTSSEESMLRVKGENSIDEDFRRVIEEHSSNSCCMGFTKRQWVILTVFMSADFLAGIVYSIKGPFYPREAEKKGATPTQYGFIFGIFELTKFFISPIYGKYMNQLGARHVFIFGMVSTGVCSILFGIMEAFGNSAFSTAAFTTIVCEFPDSIATSFASMEAFFGIGMIIGPTMGGVLFEIGGYTLPFIVTGALLFATSILVSFVMPKTTSIADPDGKLCSGFDVFRILTLPGVLVAVFGVLVAACSTGFISATLEPHIRQFDLTPVQTGLMFIIFGGVYAGSAPIWGCVCDRIQSPTYITLSGAVLISTAFFLIGPAPFIEVETTLWMTSIGLVLQGLGVAATFVSGFILALTYSTSSGFPDNISTYSVVAGLWTSINALGMFIGPSIGGILLDRVGFRWGSLLLIVSAVILSMTVVAFIIVDARTSWSRTDSIDDLECDPLVGSCTGSEASVSSTPRPLPTVDYGSIQSHTS